MDPTTVFCPNLACPARGQTGQGNIGIHSRWASQADLSLLASHHSRAALLRVRLQGVPQPTRWRCLRARRPHLVERCGASTPSLPCLRTAPLHGAVLGVHRLESRMVSLGEGRGLCVCAGMTGFGRTCNTRAVSRIALAFLARAMLCSFTAGECPRSREARRNVRPAQRRSRQRSRCVP